MHPSPFFFLGVKVRSYKRTPTNIIVGGKARVGCVLARTTPAQERCSWCNCFVWQIGKRAVGQVFNRAVGQVFNGCNPRSSLGVLEFSRISLATYPLQTGRVLGFDR